MNRKTTIDEKVSHGSLDENQAMSWARGQVFFLVFCLLLCTTTKVSEWWRCSIFCMKKWYMNIPSYPTYYILWQKSLNEKRNLYMGVEDKIGNFQMAFFITCFTHVAYFCRSSKFYRPDSPLRDGDLAKRWDGIKVLSTHEPAPISSCTTRSTRPMTRNYSI